MNNLQLTLNTPLTESQVSDLIAHMEAKISFENGIIAGAEKMMLNPTKGNIAYGKSDIYNANKRISRYKTIIQNVKIGSVITKEGFYILDDKFYM